MERGHVVGRGWRGGTRVGSGGARAGWVAFDLIFKSCGWGGRIGGARFGGLRIVFCFLFFDLVVRSADWVAGVAWRGVSPGGATIISRRRFVELLDFRGGRTEC